MAAGGRWPYPFWIAHRGGGRVAPENTLAALRAGAARGYACAELDVTLSADGLPFLLHDDTLERTLWTRRASTGGSQSSRYWSMRKRSASRRTDFIFRPSSIEMGRRMSCVAMVIARHRARL